jgi:uncharacterized damage-inducible protein DinB
MLRVTSLMNSWGSKVTVSETVVAERGGHQMISEIIQDLYRYSAWANGRILDTTMQLRAEEFLASRGSSFDSLRDTLVHIMSGQWTYLERWRGHSPRAMLSAHDFPDVPSIREHWDGIERETQAFVAELSDAQLVTDLEYTNTEGERWAYPLWQQMIHQVNHATQHRSEAAVMLTQFHHSPGWLDFLYYMDLRGAQGRA